LEWGGGATPFPLLGLEQRRVAPHEYSERLRRIQPELKELTAKLDRTSDELRREIKAKVESLVASAFDER
jgi:hypothetical protein